MPLPNNMHRIRRTDVSRDGYDIPGTTEPQQHDEYHIYYAACWSWALFGEFVSSDIQKSPVQLYQSIFKRNEYGAPEGLDTDHIEALACMDPRVIPYINELLQRWNLLIDGDENAPFDLAHALLKIQATLAGLTVSDGSSAFELTVRAETWHTWIHWGLSVRNDDNEITYIQKVNDCPVSYACNTLWDEGVAELVFAVPILELHQSHVDILSSIPDND